MKKLDFERLAQEARQASCWSIFSAAATLSNGKALNTMLQTFRGFASSPTQINGFIITPDKAQRTIL